MLKGISPLLSPELLKVLDEMGHGDEIVFADANFPTVSTGKRIVRADGIGAVELLDAVLQLFPLDQYDEDHFVLMEVVPGDPVQTPIWDEYKAVLMARCASWLALLHKPEICRTSSAWCVQGRGWISLPTMSVQKKPIVLWQRVRRHSMPI